MPTMHTQDVSSSRILDEYGNPVHTDMPSLEIAQATLEYKYGKDSGYTVEEFFYTPLTPGVGE